jgi:hypothetical protein
MKLYFFSAILVFLLCYQLQGQNYINPSLNQNEIQTPSKFLRQHHIGWAFSYAGGTATTGREGAMFSTFYSYSPEQWYDIEASLHYLGRSWGGEFIGPVRLYASSLTIDGAVLVRIADVPILRHLRLGIGPSVQFLQYVANVKSLTTPLIEYPSYSNVVLVGGAVKADYQIPINERIDIGLRGQFNLYALEFQGNLAGFEEGRRVGFAGLGVYFRLNF